MDEGCLALRATTMLYINNEARNDRQIDGVHISNAHKRLCVSQFCEEFGWRFLVYVESSRGGGYKAI